ncbi:MAG: CPBP family intramembrane glutamic endopeptidase [Caulobacteraceae bacterium]
MGVLASRLSDSVFIADLDAREKSLGRFLLTLGAGLPAGFVVGILVGVAALAAIVFGAGPLIGGADAFRTAVALLLGAQAPGLARAVTFTLLAAATNVPLAATFLAVAAAVSGRSMFGYVSAAPRFRWGLLWLGLAFSAVVIGGVVVASSLLDPRAPAFPVLSIASGTANRVGYGLVSFALLIPAAAAEEFVFRGWLLRQSAALSRNPIFLMALNGVLFSAVHGDFAPDAFLTRWVMGAGFVYMTLRLGGTEFSTGAHAANNILIVLFIQPLTLKPTPSAGITGASLFQDLFLLASYVAMAEIAARWGPLRRLAGASATREEPGA